MMKAKDIARTRGVAILAVVVCLCMVIPALAMNVQAGPDGTATFDRGHTYKWYDATGGADSGSGTVAGGEYDIGTRRVGAYANVIDFSLGTTGWARVWKAATCLESGDYYVEMKGWYSGYLAVFGLGDAEIAFRLQVRDLLTGGVSEDKAFIRLAWLGIGAVAQEGLYDAYTLFYAQAGHTYGFTLDVECWGAAALGSSVCDAFGAEGAYYNNIEVGPYFPSGGGGCIIGGSEITMADGGTMPIEKVKRGMEVLGYDFATSSFVTEEVLITAKTKVMTTVDINQGLIRATLEDHPMYVRNGTWEGWVVDPEDLRPGMELFTPLDDEVWTMITSMVYLSEKVTVYELSASLPDNYLANGVLCDLKRK